MSLLCKLGLHDYGPMSVMRTALVLRGDRSGMEVDEDPDPNRYVIQPCVRDGCRKYRKRPDVDPDEI